MNDTELRCQRDDYGGCINIALFADRGKSRATNVMMETMEDKTNCGPTQPIASLTEEKARCLFQELWDIGFRPKHEYGTEGHLSSVKDHLKDMRQLAFKSLKIPEPEKGSTR